MQFKKLFDYLRFQWKVKGILDTPPVKCDKASEVASVTQLQHRDVFLYLIAIKSFSNFLPLRKVYVLNDGSLTAKDLSILKHCVPDITIMNIVDFRSEKCPEGGTWERLIAISKLCQEQYVIQLDSDTITIGDISEIREAVNEQRAFVIGTYDDQDLESIENRVEKSNQRIVKSGSKQHVQIMAEANLDALPKDVFKSYVRGCSGFSGFPKAAFNQEYLETISDKIGQRLGKERWSEWGTEQFASNVVVANTSKPIVLPHPKYADCTKYVQSKTNFIHFIGYCRFRGGKLANLSLQLIRQLNQKGLN